MIIKEKVKLDLFSTCNQIVLSKPAIPGTAKVVIDGRPLSIENFDCYGAPILPEPFIRSLRAKNCISEIFGSPFDDTIEIDYEENTALPPLELLNNLDYINFATESLKQFNEYLADITLFKKSHPDCRNFSEVLVFGRYLIDSFGQLKILDSPLCNLPNVVYWETIPASLRGAYYSFAYNLPTERAICPYCLKPFTIDDIASGNIDVEEGRVFHKDCLDAYDTSINNSDMLRATYYGYPSIISYKEIPNEYGGECNICRRRPWLIISTPDGDIKIGWRKRVISIEFIEGFSKFPMSLFDSENVTKWKNGIHAWGYEKVTEYLRRVYNYFK